MQAHLRRRSSSCRRRRRSKRKYRYRARIQHRLRACMGGPCALPTQNAMPVQARPAMPCHPGPGTPATGVLPAAFHDNSSALRRNEALLPLRLFRRDVDLNVDLDAAMRRHDWYDCYALPGRSWPVWVWSSHPLRAHVAPGPQQLQHQRRWSCCGGTIVRCRLRECLRRPRRGPSDGWYKKESSPARPLPTRSCRQLTTTLLEPRRASPHRCFPLPCLGRA